jgi:sodium transport system permease protein
MHNVLIVAGKELVDHLRDTRALASLGLYALMGPLIIALVLLVSTGEGGDGGGESRGAALLAIMASVFTLMSAFSGASGVAVDLIAGERERRSLLPLLMNSVARLEIVAGKWLAASAFAAGSAFATLLAFIAVFAVLSGLPALSMQTLLLVPALLVLALFSAAVQVLVSTWSSSVKEGNTSVSIMIFAVMGLSMWQAFSAGFAAGWWFLVPVVGHQHILQATLANSGISLFGVTVLSGVSILVAGFVLVATARLFKRDAILYGD